MRAVPAPNSLVTRMLPANPAKSPNPAKAGQPCEVGRRILVERVNVLLVVWKKKCTHRAEGARNRRDDADGSRTGPIKDIVSNGATARDCVDLTVALVGHQDLTAVGPEG